MAATGPAAVHGRPTAAAVFLVCHGQSCGADMHTCGSHDSIIALSVRGTLWAPLVVAKDLCLTYRRSGVFVAVAAGLQTSCSLTADSQ
jgi:hypothetical protein